MTPLPVQDLQRIREHERIDVLVRPDLRIIFLGMDQHRDKAYGADLDNNPLQDVKVRKAVYHAIDIETIKSRLMYGLSEPSSVMIASPLYSQANKIERYAYDPQVSRHLLGDAGYPEGFRTSMICPNNRYVNDRLICQAIVTMLARVGIKAELQTFPMNQYVGKISPPSREFGIYLLGWTPTSMDSYNILFSLMSSYDKESGRGNVNFGQFSNREIDELTSLVDVELDSQVRDDLILRAYQVVHENAFYIPLHRQPVIWAASKRFDVIQRADDMFIFTNVRSAQ